MKPLYLMMCLFFAGCIHVPAHQRGTLMSAVMTSEGALEEGIAVHVHQTRESMLGGTTGGGASCGCN